MSARYSLWLLAATAVAALLCAPWIGAVSLSETVSAVAEENHRSLILWQFRVPRVLLAFLAGAALALGGMTFQTLFRNPLATPFTLGVASGAAVGAAVFFAFGVSASWLSAGGSVIAAFVGAAIVVSMVFALAYSSTAHSGTALILAGVVINFILSSALMLIQYVSSSVEVFRLTRWLMGGVACIGYQEPLLVAPFVAATAAYLWWHAPALDLLLAGDDVAASRGVAVHRLHVSLYFIVSLTVAAVVAVCGVISFIGLVVPYVIRCIVGARHELLIPASMLLGGTVLVVSDAVARTILAPIEIPVGIVTALCGGPFFLWLLLGAGRDARALSP